MQQEPPEEHDRQIPTGGRTAARAASALPLPPRRSAQATLMAQERELSDPFLLMTLDLILEQFVCAQILFVYASKVFVKISSRYFSCFVL